MWNHFALFQFRWFCTTEIADPKTYSFNKTPYLESDSNIRKQAQMSHRAREDVAFGLASKLMH
jgi:hypothetical protein